MTDVELGALLADVGQAGSYFVDARDRAALVEAATTLEFAVVTIDLENAEDKPSLLEAMADGLLFPEWFGGNWDALADCLGDLSWLDARHGLLLLLDHSGDLRENAPDDFATLLDILDEAARQHAAAGVAFWALLPAVSTPS
ncbi:MULTISPECIES: barstar family protein [unclassified Luteimonas]|uniref:barstar family protein n=1 Tax=unclassified Luteimonas TaxID=2629088 RepID=UPI0015FF0401|nr:MULTISPECIES: barstar family protein [unclassified Luteimonas]MBB1473213.1 barstar family protein [Luteimonas sp. MC1782]MBB6598083.1 barstar family protein [Luteimonas sp. MC1825]QOC88319.1 barstar family protein [Luteimonas sp. MC1825]